MADIQIDNKDDLDLPYDFENMSIEQINQKAEEIEQESKRECAKIAKIKTSTLEKVFRGLTNEEITELYHLSKHLDSDMKSCVYFILNKENNRVKIGYSSKPERRFRQIKNQFYSLGLKPELELVAVQVTFSEYANELESKYHDLFSEQRVEYEWFDVDKETLFEEITLGSEDWEHLEGPGALVSYAYDEFLFFGELDFNLTVQPGTVYNKVKADTGSALDRSPFVKTRNKAYSIIEKAIDFEVGLLASPVLNDQNQVIRRGLEIEGTEKKINFRRLKEEKIDLDYWGEIISQFNQEL